LLFEMDYLCRYKSFFVGIGVGISGVDAGVDSGSGSRRYKGG